MSLALAPILPMPVRPRGPRRTPCRIKYMTQDELSRLLNVARERGCFAMLYTTYRYALRVSELCALTWGDVFLDSGRIRIPRSKGGHSNEYPLCPIVGEELRLRKGQGSPYVFPGRKGALSTRRVQQIFDGCVDAAGLRAELSVHSLRHSLAVHAIESGLSIDLIADLLGHRSRKTTEVYATVSTRAREEACRILEQSEFILRPGRKE